MSDETRPLILLDVDGVINVSGSADTRRSKCFHDGWQQAKRWAYGGGPYRVFYNPAIGRPLRELARETGAELAWATMWEDYANREISPLLGLPQDLAVSPARDGRFTTGYKASAVVPWTAGRPFVWFDDEEPELDEAKRLAGDQDCLMVLIDEYEGLTEAHLNLARTWLADRARESTERSTQMPQETAPKPVEGFAAGHTIEHRLVTGFPMHVLDRRPCETDATHPSEHPSYKVIDPEGNEDWLCHYDVQEPGAGLPFGVPE